MGSRLKYLRDNMKLSQIKVAKLIGTVTQTASNHGQPEKNPLMDILLESLKIFTGIWRNIISSGRMESLYGITPCGIYEK